MNVASLERIIRLYKACSALTEREFQSNSPAIQFVAIRARCQKWNLRPLTARKKTISCKARPSCERNRMRIGNSFLETLGKISDRVGRVVDAFVKELANVFGEQRRAKYHHARRGGLSSIPRK